MSKKNADKDRKAKIAEMQRQARAAERRRTLMIIGAAVAVVALIAGAVGFAIIRDPNRLPGGELNELGVPAASASCDAVTTDQTTGSGTHVGPQTNKPDVTTVKYATVPPSSGEHFVAPEYPNRQFYSAQDRPKMENLVHNLEHGYTVLWYDTTATDEQIAQLKAISKQANASIDAGDKFIVSSWDPAYGAFPEGKHYAMSHWAADPKDLTKQTGHRQLCGQLSGEVVASFIKQFPKTLAPEPNAQ